MPVISKKVEIHSFKTNAKYQCHVKWYRFNEILWSSKDGQDGNLQYVICNVLNHKGNKHPWLLRCGSHKLFSLN